MKHETHLSAEQIETQAEVRIPRPNENTRRSQSDPSPTPRRAKSPFCLTKSDKLLKRSEFLAIGKRGQRLVGKFLCIDWKKASCLRFGISASGRFGDSVERNRFKRLVREAFRSARSHLPFDRELHIIPRQKAKEAKMGDIREELIQLVK